MNTVNQHGARLIFNQWQKLSGVPFSLCQFPPFSGLVLPALNQVVGLLSEDAQKNQNNADFVLTIS